MRLSTLFLSATAIIALVSPAVAQERVAVGSGVAPSTRQNSPERPIRFAAAVPAGSVVVVPVLSADGVASAANGLGAATADTVAAAARAARFSAKAGKTLKLPNIGGYPLVLLVGVAGADQASEERFADAGGTAMQALRDEPHDIAFLAGGLPAGAAAYVAYGASLGQYRFDRLKSSVTPPPVNPVTIVSADGSAAATFNNDLAHVARSVRFARDLITLPANELYPESFVAAVRDEVKGLADVRVTVLDETQMRALGMGSILGVAQGSRRPARMLAVEYTGGKGAPVALVGKGITFDSGGISLKNPPGMWEMKGDMSGAASTIATVIAAARRHAGVNAVAVAALAENMPGGNAQRPGDVVRTMNGQTIEIMSTDAEGRLVLADANQWAIERFKPRALVNLATLTGSVAAALGDEYAGLFARDENLASRLATAGTGVSEPLWRLPIHSNYAADLESEVADLKNGKEGGGPGGGLAAQFINYLTPGPTPWAHVDMAGVDRANSALPTVPRGARGYGVRLFDALLRSYEAKAD